jgi:hypothetical protein
MARNGRGGVRYGLLFAVLAFVSYTTGVSTHGSVAAELAAELAAEPATELRSLHANAQPTAQSTARPTGDPTGVPTEQPTAQPTAQPKKVDSQLDCKSKKKIGQASSYPQNTPVAGSSGNSSTGLGFTTYCLTLGNSNCWRGKNAAGFMRYHYKGQTPDGKPLCPKPATWNGKELKARSKTLFNYTASGDKIPTYTKVIINNEGVWRCKEASNVCWCRDYVRDEYGAYKDEPISDYTCGEALLTKPFCTGKNGLPGKCDQPFGR